MFKKVLLALALVGVFAGAKPAHASFISTVQISTFGVTQQAGAFNVVGGTMSFVNVATVTVTSSMTITGAASLTVGAILSTNTFGVGIQSNQGTTVNLCTTCVGYSVSSATLAGGITLTNATLTDLVSIPLTGGDWICTGGFDAALNGATMTEWDGGISITAGNNSTGMTTGTNRFGAIIPTAATDSSFSVPPYELSSSGSFTVYLKVEDAATVGSPKVAGSLRCTRK